MVVCCSAVLFSCGGGGGSGSDSTSENIATGLSVLSGKITASEGNYVDSDTNNPTAYLASNNTSNDAQIIPNVATIGGFMTIPRPATQVMYFNSRLIH